jgi:hypothetical protein
MDNEQNQKNIDSWGVVKVMKVSIFGEQVF